MSFSIVLISLVGVSVCFNLPSWSPFYKDVIELNSDNFMSTVDKYENSLVMFYAPWCEHCKRLEPQFEKAAKILRNNKPPVRLMKIDCTAEGKDICKKYDIRGYPTLKIFKGSNNSRDYYGPRGHDGLITYMKKVVCRNEYIYTEKIPEEDLQQCPVDAGMCSLSSMKNLLFNKY